jgi:peptidoglycan/LPS O-acetylase OafA/YrhL
MQGALRLYLAASVVAGHMWHYLEIAPVATWFGEVGVTASVAVACFFILAGFVADQQIERYFWRNGTVDAIGYYRDRLLRIYPTYLLIIILAAPIYFLCAKHAVRIDGLGSFLTFFAINLMPPVLNLSLMDSGTGFEYAVSPVSWSLGVELVFYVLAPLLIVVQRKYRTLALLGVAVLLALEPLLRLRPELTSYVDPLFNLKYFCLGIAAHRVYRAMPRYIDFGLGGAVTGVAAVMLAGHATQPLMTTLFGLGTNLVFVGFTAIIVVSAVLVKTNALDLFLGHISYPLFLLHVPVMWFVRSNLAMSPEYQYRIVFALSFAASAAIYVLFDRWINRVRKMQQGKTRMITTSPDPLPSR